MTVQPGKRSVTVVAVLIVLTLLFIVGIVRVKRNSPIFQRRGDFEQQASGAGDTRALYIAQTALDRSIKELVADPKWRDGFTNIPFESGTYNVRVYDARNGDRGEKTAIPPNYVKIVASSEVNGVTKEVEAVWVNAMSAFRHVYAAGNQIEIANHRARRFVAFGNLNNNSWNGGRLTIDRGVTLYGSATSVGDIQIGSTGSGQKTIVYGSVCGSRIYITEDAEMRKFDNLAEAEEGVDLNRDGDAEDIGVGGGAMRVRGVTAITSGGRTLRPGDTDSRIANGALPVSVGGEGVGTIVDPRPDFIVYYELVTGLSSYPPSLEHISTAITGDGDGHYFASASDFTEWLGIQTEKGVLCWRCAGDGHIGPQGGASCPTCGGRGEDTAVEVAGVFYVDDATLDLSSFGRNLIVHGTIIVAMGNPYEWLEKEINLPGGTATIDHFPRNGRFVLSGESRMHFTQTYRSDEDGGSYTWKKRTLFRDENTQTIPIPMPFSKHVMRDFPAILAASQIEIAPRRAGFAHYPGDIGDERVTILQGVVYAEDKVALHGQGGWTGDVLFDEELERNEDDVFEEAILNVDLNDDGDTFDSVETGAITMVPVIRVAMGKYNIDINNDGVLQKVTIGVDYLGFFDNNDYEYPILIYLEGLVLGQTIHSCEQALAIFDSEIGSGLPFGFEVNFGSTTYQGLVSWWERGSP